MPSSIYCTWLTVPSLLTSLCIGWSHDFEQAVATPASQANNLSLRVTVSESAVDLTIDKSSDPQHNQVLDWTTNPQTASNDLLCSMENPQIVLLNREGKKLNEDELMNAHLNFPLTLRLTLAKCRSGQPQMFQLLEQHQDPAAEESASNETWWGSTWETVKGHATAIGHVVKDKVIKHGKQALVAVGTCSLGPAATCMAIPATCGGAIASVTTCVKGKAEDIKKGVIESAKEVKVLAKKSMTTIGNEVLTQGEKVTKVIGLGVERTIGKITSDTRDTVNALVDKTLLAVSRMDGKLGTSMGGSVEDLRNTMLMSLADLEKEALAQTTKMAADTGEKLGELKGSADSQVRLETNIVAKEAEETGVVIQEAAEKGSIAATKAGSLLNMPNAEMIHEVYGIEPGPMVESEGRGAVDEHAHPKVAIVDQASLTMPAPRMGSKSKRKGLMRQEVSWQGSFDKQVPVELRDNEDKLRSLQEQIHELQSRNDVLHQENKAQGETIARHHTDMAKVADLAAEKAASQFRKMMENEHKHIEKLQHENKQMRSIFGAD